MFDKIESRLEKLSPRPLAMFGVCLFMAGVALRNQDYESAGRALEAFSVLPLEASIWSKIIHIENNNNLL